MKYDLFYPFTLLEDKQDSRLRGVDKYHNSIIYHGKR